MRPGLIALLGLLIVLSVACKGAGKPRYDDASTGIVIATIEAKRSVDAPMSLGFPPLTSGTVVSGALPIGATPAPRATVTPAATTSAIAVTATPPPRSDTSTATPRPGSTPSGPVVSPTRGATPSTASISCSVPANPSAPKVDLKTIDGTNGVTLLQRIETKTYAVSGCNANDIAASLRGATNQSSAGRFEVGITSSTTRYSYRYEEQNGNCKLKGASIASDITVLLPELSNTLGISDQVMARWQAFMAALRTHEQGHVDIILKSAGSIKATFEAQQSAAPCATLESTLKGAVQRETDVANAANDAYDTQTNHGVKQGVAFP
jgi:predicted secreted Zn-dependent protease